MNPIPDLDPPPAPACDPEAAAASPFDTRSASGDTAPPTDSDGTQVYLNADGPDGAAGRRAPAIPGYEIEAVLGRGGMGVVYRARHVALKRTVALKMVLAGGHAGPAELARFRIEAEAVARLQHPNIVQIHEVGQADGFPYCALEYVEGGTLAARIDDLDDRPMAPAEAARLVEELARAMQLAHSRNVIHRDLKPANILLTANGTPKITDFGLARQLDSDSGETKTGAVMGTPSFMAPEQAAGRTNEAGPAADVYALGAILYACLAGRPPFKGMTVVETLDQVRTREPEPPSRVRPGVPLDLETICLKCLRKEPERRYPSAHELADDLARFGRREPITARPVGARERFGLWWRRNPALAPLVAAMTVLVLATAVAAIVAAVQFWKLSDERAAALKDAKAEKDNAVVALGKATRALGMSTQAEALTAWEGGNVTLARSRLDAVDPDARFWEWRYLHRLFHPTQYYPEREATIPHVAWSPDGATVVAGTSSGTVVLRDGATGGERRRIAAHADSVLGLAFSPDGRHLATAGADGAVRVWSLPDGKLHRELLGEAGAVSTLCWQPHGVWLAIGTSTGRVRLWDGVAGTEREPLANGPAEKEPSVVTALAFDPSGRALARATAGGSLTIQPLDGADPLAVPGPHDLHALAFSPDGALLAGGGRKLELWDATTGALVRELPLYSGKPDGYQHLVTGLDFRGDGQRLVSSCGGYACTSVTAPGPDTSVRIWNLLDGRLVRALRSTGGSVRAVRYSPDGQRLAGGAVAVGSPHLNGGLGVWDVRGDGEHRVLSGSRFRLGGTAFSPDGSRLVSVGGSSQSVGPLGDLSVWDPATGTRVAAVRHDTPLDRVAFAPDGRTFATANRAGTLEIWDATTATRTRAIPAAHAERVAALDYFPDGRLASFGEDGWVRVWSRDRGAATAELKRPSDTLRCPTGAVHPLGEFVAIGARLHSGDDLEEIVLWWPADGRTEVLDRVKGGTAAVGFSPDGTKLAAVGGAGELVIWDAVSRRRVRAFTAHEASPTAVAFSPDGRRLATIARDRSVRVWDVETGRQTLVLVGPTFSGDTLRFSPDGHRLVAGGGGGFELTPGAGDLFVWDAAPFADSSHRPDPAWHAAQIDQRTDLSPHGFCFHGRFSAQALYSPYDTARVAGAFADVRRGLKRGDPRLPTVRRHLAEFADAAAGQYPREEVARSALIDALLAPLWRDATPAEAVSEGGAKLSVEPNGFVAVSGVNPDRDTYTLTVPVPVAGVTGLRLMMRADPAHNGLLGRAAKGKFDLSEIEFALRAGGNGPAKGVKLSRARASFNATAKEHFSKKDMRAEFAIDGDPATAWSSWPQVTVDQTLVVETERAAGETGDAARVRLQFRGEHKQNALALFRIEFTDDAAPVRRDRWAAELAKRRAPVWTVLAAAAWIDDDADRVLAACAKANELGETPLDAALAAWALTRKKEETAKAAVERVRELVKNRPPDSLIEELIGR